MKHLTVKDREFLRKQFISYRLHLVWERRSVFQPHPFINITILEAPMPVMILDTGAEEYTVYDKL